jgi:hypothetical protein
MLDCDKIYLMEDNQNENKSPDETYQLYTDPALLEAAHNDLHFDILLDGLKKAEEIAASRTDNPAFQHVAVAAEEGVRSWIARKGYLTQEPPEEPRP